MRTLFLILALTNISCRTKEAPFDSGTSGDSDSAATETATPVDADGDGFTAAEDCDDADASINPSALDDDCDGVDENCDGQADDAAVWETYYLDADGDGSFTHPLDDCSHGRRDTLPITMIFRGNSAWPSGLLQRRQAQRVEC